MINIYDIILKAKSARATDIHLSVNNPPIIRIDGFLVRMQVISHFQSRIYHTL